jgi:hypothetical protein
LIGWKIAVAQAITVRHVRKALQQDVPSRLVEKFRSLDFRRQLQLETAELVHRVTMNACLQPSEYFEVLGTIFGSPRMRSANDAPFTRSYTIPQRPLIC